MTTETDFKVETCVLCGKPLGPLFKFTENRERVHPHCFNKRHPPEAAQTLYQMARGVGDPVLAAEVIAQWVPHELASQIVSDFNRRLMMQWQRTCEPFEEPENVPETTNSAGNQPD